MQGRDTGFVPRSPLEALLARADAAALDYLADRLVSGEPVEAEAVPPASEEPADDRDAAVQG
jgi:hypothetical protein